MIVMFNLLAVVGSYVLPEAIRTRCYLSDFSVCTRALRRAADSNFVALSRYRYTEPVTECDSCATGAQCLRS